MKMSLLVLLVFAAASAQASESVVLKRLRCENSKLKALVLVTQALEGSAGVVEWHVKNKATGEVTKSSGYLSSDDGLKSFSSSDVFDSIEIDGTQLTISNDGQDEVLSCQ